MSEREPTYIGPSREQFLEWLATAGIRMQVNSEQAVPRNERVSSECNELITTLELARKTLGNITGKARTMEVVNAYCRVSNVLDAIGCAIAKEAK